MVSLVVYKMDDATSTADLGQEFYVNVLSDSMSFLVRNHHPIRVRWCLNHFIGGLRDLKYCDSATQGNNGSMLMTALRKQLRDKRYQRHRPLTSAWVMQLMPDLAD